MTYEFRFPDVGEGITEGELVKWLVKVGDKVKEDQPVAKVETDKAVAEVPSPKTGTITKLNVKEGETIKVGQVLFTLEESDKSVSVVGSLEEAPVYEAKKELPKPKEVIAEKQILATPSVRALAKQLNIDITKLTGTGPDGMITEEDVKKSSSLTPQIKITKKYDMYGYLERVPLRGIRKATAIKMTEFLQVPAVTHMDEIDVTELVKLREKEKKIALKKKIKLSYLPFIVKAVIESLKLHPYLNSSLEGDEIVLKKYYNIGIAADTPEGLLVPVLKIADSKTLIQIAKEIQELAEKAVERKLDLADLKGSTFSITNIGVLGGKFATPATNYPEAAILAIGKIYDKVTTLDGKKIVIRKTLPLSLTFDHRILDGAEAARFVNDIKKFLEDPKILFKKIN